MRRRPAVRETWERPPILIKQTKETTARFAADQQPLGAEADGSPPLPPDNPNPLPNPRVKGEYLSQEMNKVSSILSIVAGTAISGPAFAAPGDITYVRPIGNQYSEGWGYAVNDRGDVAGLNVNQGTGLQHGFKYVDGATHDLQYATMKGTWGYGINNAGTVVGHAALPSGRRHAFKNTGSTIVDLGTLGGTSSTAYDINDNGVVVGFSSTGTQSHAFRHDGSGMADLGTLGGTFSRAYAINDAGTIVGYSSVSGDGASRAFRYDDAGMVDLGIGGQNSEARGINASGVIVGNRDSRAFRLDGTTFTDLGTFDGKNYSFAYDVNDGGAVVGYASFTLPTGTNSYKAALWKSDNTIVDLDAWLNATNPAAGSKWRLVDATSISDTGLITGYGFYVEAPGVERTAAYVLDASSLVPEPNCLWLAAAVLLVRRRKRPD